MIPRTTNQNIDWKQELREAITCPEELLEQLELPRSEWLTSARRASQLFPLKIPRGVIERIQKGQPHDPILRQFMPLAEELNIRPDYTTDPVGDHAACPVPGLIHKYSSRALLISTGACAVNCRYCFRRHYPYADSHTGGQKIAPAIRYLQQNPSINEAILSGGDPLMLDDPQLNHLLQQISAIPHIRWIRIHSRLPVVLPSRITDNLAGILTSHKPLSMVIHCNHPEELGPGQRSALHRLRDEGIRLYNQSVLLKGVNNDATILTRLSTDLFDNHVQPYYLHLLDRVEGAAHFDVAVPDAIAIYRSMQASLSGLLLPRLVQENAGESSKTLINI